MTILVCDCSDNRACDFHAAELYAMDEGEDDHRDEQRAFEDASADFYLPGWTPDDQDARDLDDRILQALHDESFALRGA